MKPTEDTILTNPAQARAYQSLANCLHCRPHHVFPVFPEILQVEHHTIRCQLKWRCPWCMRPDNVAKMRIKDFEALQEAAVIVGGSRNGRGNRIWVIEWESTGPLPTPKNFARWMGEDEGRRLPIMSGQWAGEMAVCGSLPAIIAYNGRNSPALLLVIVVTGPNEELNKSRLSSKLPGAKVTNFHDNLAASWYYYLHLWAGRREEATPEQAAVRITSERSQHMFYALGEMQGLKAHEEREKTRYRRNTKGKSFRAVYCTDKALKEPQAILESCRETLSEKWKMVTGKVPLSQDTAKIMLQMEARMTPFEGNGWTKKLDRVDRRTSEIRAELAALVKELHRRNAQDAFEQERQEHEELARGPKRVQ